MPTLEGVIRRDTRDRGTLPRSGRSCSSGRIDHRLACFRIQIKIAEDAKANSATRQRAADSVAELVKARAERKGDEEKIEFVNENSRLRAEITTLTQQIAEVKRSTAGKVDPSEVAAMSSELSRLRADAQTHGARLTAAVHERDAAMTALRYMVESLGNDAPKIAMRLFVELRAKARDLLPLFGVDAEPWFRLSNYQTKAQLVDVFRKRTATNETELTAYCRLRLAVEYGIDDVAAEVKRITEGEERERLEASRQMMEELRKKR
jgi:hypothetical protein